MMSEQFLQKLADYAFSRIAPNLKEGNSDEASRAALVAHMSYVSLEDVKMRKVTEEVLHGLGFSKETINEFVTRVIVLFSKDREDFNDVSGDLRDYVSDNTFKERASKKLGF